jgi:MoxR-like ATPase
MNIATLKEALPYLFKANVSTMIVGHHGVGKSQGVAQYAAENDMEFIDLRLGTQDVGDLLGLADFERDRDGNLVATKFMRPDWFPTNPNSKGIIFLDEINRARRDVLQAVFQLVLDKRLHRYELPKGWQVIAAMNPNTGDYIVTDISDKAFMDRFCHIKLAPSKQEFFKYARERKFDDRLIQFLQEQPEMLQGELEAFDLSEIKPSRRSWEAIDRLIKVGTPVHILTELACGLVGPVAASAMTKALNSADKPINAADVVDNYSKFQKRVQDYSDAKNARLDMLKFTCDSILEWAQSDKKALTKDQAKNLADFLWDIPRDLSFSLARELYMEERTRPVIDEHQDLLKDIANKRNIKVKGVNVE